MKIDLPVGTRGKIVEFNKSYTREFLKKYGVKFYTKPSVLNSIVLAETVQTKHGEIVVHDYNVLTYVGGKKMGCRAKKGAKRWNCTRAINTRTLTVLNFRCSVL